MDWSRFNPLARHAPAAPAPAPAAMTQVDPTMPATADAVFAYVMNDPFLADILTDGLQSASGATVNARTALRNPAMFRAVSLISGAMGMLPLHVLDAETKEKAKGHPLYRLLHRRPNGWQSAYDFRSLMQLRALTSDRPATALIIRSRQIRTNRDEVVRLIPLDPDRVQVKQRPDWTVVYEYQPPEGGRRTFASGEILHLKGLSLDGLNGVSLVRQARDAIGLALSAELAAGRLFKNGVLAPGKFTHPGKLSDGAYQRLKASLGEHEGAEGAGKTMILEEGMKFEAAGSSAKDAELAALRKMQVEEIARVTGVPRPLLMVDETSWGSGIQALGQFFVMYALNPWFAAWQQASELSLLADDEVDRFSIEFNADALLKGSTKDQGDFFAKALGAGGQRPWMTQDEVRKLSNLPPKGGAHAELALGASEGEPGSPPESEAQDA